MQETIQQPKRCNYCNKEIRGRSDKKFCNDYCRNIFNNQLHATDNNLIRKVNHALGKNRRILDELSGNSKIIKIKKEELLYLGFRFNYQTHFYKGKTGTDLYGCYDFLYFTIHEEWCVLFRN